jgi:hypothetical protein
MPWTGTTDRSFAEHPDAWPETGDRGRRPTPVERVDRLTGVQLAEELQRDVPVLLGDEAHAALMLAVQHAQRFCDVLRRPDPDEQSWQRRSAHAGAPTSRS